MKVKKIKPHLETQTKNETKISFFEIGFEEIADLNGVSP
jgi:hypothetical protein